MSEVSPLVRNVVKQVKKGLIWLKGSHSRKVSLKLVQECLQQIRVYLRLSKKSLHSWEEGLRDRKNLRYFRNGVKCVGEAW